MWVVNPRLALVGSVSWARSRDLATTVAPKLDVFTSDIGAELRSAKWQVGGPVSLSTFAELGAGTSAVRNDVALMGALHVNRRRVPQQ